MTYQAVIFDIGGVVVGSPLAAIADYERAHGIARGAINHVVATTGAEGSWACLERGELSMDEFYPRFDRDCAAAGVRISARALMAAMAEAAVPRPAMLEAIRRIRAGGLRAAAVTNNWISETEDTRALQPHFDVLIESSVVGLRKPDPRIYRLACERLAITPPEAVFLDDIGANLKAARALGMHTIKVDEPEQALAELDRALGFALLGPG
jgi:epoxide hydrolase-like predicted phosphatase